MLHSLSYSLNQLILSNQTSPKPGESVCHPAGLSLPAFCDSSSTFSFEGTGVTIFSTVTSPASRDGKRPVAWAVGNRTPRYITKEQKLAFAAVGTERVVVSGPPSLRKRTRLGQIWIRTGLDPICSATFRRRRYTVGRITQTNLTKSERGLEASEK